MSTSHIVFFTQPYYTDMTTTATIMTDLVEDLACKGAFNGTVYSVEA